MDDDDDDDDKPYDNEEEHLPSLPTSHRVSSPPAGPEDDQNGNRIASSTAKPLKFGEAGKLRPDGQREIDRDNDVDARLR